MNTEDSGISTFGLLRLDPRDRTIYCRGKRAKLGEREFDLLLMLAKHVDRVVSYERLNRHIWGETQEILSSGQRLTVLRLRRKLLAECIDEVQITNFAGKGYRLRVSTEDSAEKPDATCNTNS
jgi:DNA-binding response OmpR family regulator